MNNALLTPTTAPTTVRLREDLTRVYSNLREQLEKALEIKQAHALAIRTHADAQRAILVATADPKELGANEAARQATLDTMCAETKKQVQSLDLSVQQSAVDVELARLDLEEQRCYLRLLEVTKCDN